jgi:mannitol-1-phosphate/altronate dehydrogenase
VIAHSSTVDLSPAAERRLEADEAEREWMLRPLLAALAGLEQRMAQGFAEEAAAVAALSGEGAETRSRVDTMLALLQAAQQHNATLQQTADAILADLQAAGQGASERAQTILAVKSELDTEQQRVDDAVAALQPAPEPAP